MVAHINQSRSLLSLALLSLLISLAESGQLKFAVVPNYPATYCQNIGDQGTDLITGFEVDFFVKVMETLNLKQDDADGYVLVCQPQIRQQILNGQFNLYTEFDGVIGAIPITSTLVKLGYQYSLPTIIDGLSVVQNFEVQKSFIQQSISWKAILLIIFTIFIASILFIMFEHKNIYYVDYFYHTFTSFFMVKEQFLITSSAKMIQLVFWLLGLVFMMFMISNMVLEFFRQYKIRLTNFGQLNGQVIYTEDLFSNYTTDFLSYQETFAYSGNTVNIGQFMEDNAIQFALVETFKANLAEHSTCSVSMAIRNAYDLNFGILFQRVFSAEKVKAINEGVILTYKSFEPTQEQLNYIQRNFNKCSSSGGGKTFYRELKVKLEDYWPCMIAMVAISICAFFWSQLKRKIKKVYPTLFYPFETQYGRRKRDQHIARECKTKWKSGLKDVISEIKKEYTYRLRGVDLLKDYILQEKRFKQNQLALAYENVLQQYPNNEIQILDNPQQIKLIQELEDNYEPEQKEQLIDLNDITRQTPLTEFFLNRPKQHQIQTYLQKKEQDHVFFQVNSKLINNLGYDLGADKLGDQDNYQNATMNQPGGMQNFKLGIVKMRKQSASELEKQTIRQQQRLVNTIIVREEEKIPIRDMVTEERMLREELNNPNRQQEEQLDEFFGLKKQSASDQRNQSSKAQSQQKQRSANAQSKAQPTEKKQEAERSYQDDSRISDIKKKDFLPAQKAQAQPLSRQPEQQLKPQGQLAVTPPRQQLASAEKEQRPIQSQSQKNKPEPSPAQKTQDKQKNLIEESKQGTQSQNRAQNVSPQLLQPSKNDNRIQQSGQFQKSQPKQEPKQKDAIESVASQKPEVNLRPAQQVNLQESVVQPPIDSIYMSTEKQFIKIKESQPEKKKPNLEQPAKEKPEAQQSLKSGKQQVSADKDPKSIPSPELQQTQKKQPDQADKYKQIQSAPQQKQAPMANEIIESDDEFNFSDVDVQSNAIAQKKLDPKQQFLKNLKIKTGTQQQNPSNQQQKPANLPENSFDDLASNKSSEITSQLNQQKSSRILHQQKSLESQNKSENQLAQKPFQELHIHKDSFDNFLLEDDQQKKPQLSPKSKNADELSSVNLELPPDSQQINAQEKQSLTGKKQAGQNQQPADTFLIDLE